MKLNKITLSTIFSLALLASSIGLTNSANAKEELSVIQTVSKNRKSFVVAKGAKDGIIMGQEMIYANDNVSIVCRVQEISRDFSLWVPVDTKANVPFIKDEIVNLNSVVYGNVALNIVGAPYLVNDISVAKKFEHFRIENNYSIKFGLNRGLSQSSASVSEDKNSSRTGYMFEGYYHYRFMPEFEMAAGFRYDGEVYRIHKPELDIPTKRMILMGSLTYHFTQNPENKNNYYLTLAAGIGKSKTTINQIEASGQVRILPEVKLGYLVPFKRKTAMVTELSVESISTTEKFSTGENQTTNIINMKASIGLRF